MTPNSREDALSARMDDLVTGQLSPLAGWLLRRQIAGDPELKRQWESLRDMHANLQDLVVAGEAKTNVTVRTRHNATRPSVVPTFQIGGIVMKQRTAIVAAVAMTLFAMTGAIAARYFAPREGDCGLPGADRDFDWWYFHGTFRGKATVLSPEGNVINSIDVQGSSESGSVFAQFTQHSREVAHDTLHGMGRHAIHDRNGKLVGYVDLSPLSKTDEASIAQDDREVQEDMADFIRRPERVTPSDDKRGFSPITTLPGVIGGTSMELVGAHGVENWYSHPYSWKSYGNVHVVVHLRRNAETWVVNAESGKKYLVSLKKRTLIDEGESLPELTTDQLSRLSPEQRQAREALPRHPVTTPETYWAIAQQDGNFVATTAKGEWKTVLHSGKFEGYGHFVVRDPDSYAIVMTLDISRPAAKSASDDPLVQPKITVGRLVPGWDSER